MERKTRALYEAVFMNIQNTFPNFVTNTIVTDYETALVESLRAAYPQTSLHGCFFHFCQAIQCKAKTIGLVRQIEGNADGRRLLRKYYSLALLPEHMIVETLHYLSDNNREFNQTFRELHEYVRRQWIDRVTPQHFSVFRQRHRTNNVMESYHRRLNSKLVRHPGIWDLMETLIDIQNTTSIELAHLERQGRVFRVVNKNIVFNAHLSEAWDKLSDGRFTIGDFFRQSVHFLEGLDRNLYQWNEDVPNADVPPNLPPAAVPDPEQAPNPLANPQIDPLQPPPLIYIRAVPPAAPPLLPVQLPIHNALPLLPQIHQPPVQNEPPPLIFFHAEPPVVPPNENLPLDPNEDIQAQLVGEPLSPQLAQLPEPDFNDFPLLPPDPPSPDRPMPPMNFNFPAIPMEVERVFRQLGDNEDGDDAVQNVEQRWEPEIPATEFDETTMAPVLRCIVCYLNKTQYVVTCGHAFCSSCVDSLFNIENPRCAICRECLITVPQKLFLV